MRITERQSAVLDAIIREYIDSAQPVSSQAIQKRHDFDICPASIRIEMQKLADKGFIIQPHISAGRIPTDKGYRFFVDHLIREEKSNEAGAEDWPKDEINDTLKLFQFLTKKMASESHVFVLAYLKNEDVFWKEGWEQVLREPEFRTQERIFDFARLLENIEKKIGDINADSEMKIYIGRENPFSKTREFSVIVSKCGLAKGEEGIVSILGPKRMPYEKNIETMNSMIRLLEE